jgi:hypothetical protein
MHLRFGNLSRLAEAMIRQGRATERTLHLSVQEKPLLREELCLVGKKYQEGDVAISQGDHVRMRWINVENGQY